MTLHCIFPKPKVVRPSQREVIVHCAQDLHIAFKRLSVEPANTPAQESHVICPHHWTPVVEPAFENIGIQQEVSTHVVLVVGFRCHGVPNSVEESVESDLCQCVLTAGNPFAHSSPELRVDQRRIATSYLLETSKNHQSLLKEVKQCIASRVVEHRCATSGALQEAIE